MSRLQPIDPSTFNASELATYQQVTAVKQNPRGPTAIWSRSPALAAAAIPLGNYLRFHSSLSDAQRELSILIAARAHSSQNEWHSHRPLAEKAGVPVAAIEAIAQRGTPQFTDHSLALVCDVATMLAQSHDLDDALYARAVAGLGERGLIELITTVGFYGMLALLLRSTRAQLPDGVTPPLPT